jgi:uncharacterized heparinase superfamily protein
VLATGPGWLPEPNDSRAPHGKPLQLRDDRILDQLFAGQLLELLALQGAEVESVADQADTSVMLLPRFDLTTMRAPATNAGRSFGRRVIRTLRRTGRDPVMAGRLVWHHAGERIKQQRLRTSYSRIVCVERPSRLELPSLALPGMEAWPAELRTSLDELRAEADAALRHEIDLLGSGPVDLGPEIDWHRDFKSGYRWPEVFYQDLEITRLTDDSDAKVAWDLSRGHHLLALARAAAVFGDEAAGAEVQQQLHAWIEANPPGIGINWTNPMEIAIRAVNWVWALATLDAVRPLEVSLRGAVARSLAAHGRHIFHNLEGSPQLRSNHYMSDIVGLLVIAAVLPDDPTASRWWRYARRALEREARAQVLPDGVDFEASLPYHGLILELLLTAHWVAAWKRRPLSDSFDAVLRRMLRASLLLRHPSGRIPQFGDGDSGRILPAGSGRPPIHDHLLWAGSAMLATPVPDGQVPHIEVALNYGLDAWRDVAADAERRLTRDLPATHSFPHAGLHVLRSARLHLVVRCGDVGQNGNGGHAHNDLLSFELSCDGVLVIADPGTYAYTSDVGARNEGRSTRAHSTVQLDGYEINPFDAAEVFRMPAWAHALPASLRVTEADLELTCGHDGFRTAGVTVKRTFRVDRHTHTVCVRDQLLGAASRPAVSRLQLAPGGDVRTETDGNFEVHIAGTAIAIAVVGDDNESTIESAPVSERYGVRVSAPRLVVSKVRAVGPFGYDIKPLEHSQRH